MANIVEITDFHANELTIYAHTSEVKLLHYNEPKEGIFIAESPKVIERALSAGYKPLSFLVEHDHLATKASAIINQHPQVPVYTAPFELLTKITGYKLTKGMLCAMERKPLPTVEAICENKRRIVILENVMNPTNVGAIFRNAAALNMDGILLTNGCSNPLYRRSSRVSMGTVFQIPWTFLPKQGEGQNAVDLSVLHQLGFKTAAMLLQEDSISIDDPGLLAEERLAIILGTEGDGLADSTIGDSDYAVCIPMSHGVDSLNVAAASAIAFWQLGK